MSNLKRLFAFFIRNWKPILLALMIGTLLYQNFSGTRFVFGINTIPALEQKITKLEADLQACSDGNEAISNAIERRNEEITKWKEISEQLEIGILVMKDDIVKIREDNDKKVKNILNQKAPETCEAAIEYLREGVEDLQWDE